MKSLIIWSVSMVLVSYSQASLHAQSLFKSLRQSAFYLQADESLLSEMGSASIGINVLNGNTIYVRSDGIPSTLRVRLPSNERDFASASIKSAGKTLAEFMKPSANAYLPLVSLNPNVMGPVRDSDMHYGLSFEGRCAGIANAGCATIFVVKPDGTVKRMNVYDADPISGSKNMSGFGRLVDGRPDQFARVGMSLRAFNDSGTKQLRLTAALTRGDVINIQRNGKYIRGRDTAQVGAFHGHLVNKLCISGRDANGVLLRNGIQKLELARVASKTDNRVIRKITAVPTADEACISATESFYKPDLAILNHVPYVLKAIYADKVVDLPHFVDWSEARKIQ